MKLHLYILVTTVLFVCIFIPACNRQRSAQSGSKAPVSRCTSEVEAIPEMTAIVRSRSKGSTGIEQGDLQGLEMAITINGIIQSRPNPDIDEEYHCNTENSEENFNKIITALKNAAVPPTVAFVSGRYFDPKTGEKWLQNGNRIGFLNYSRFKATSRTPQEFIEDIGRNEQALDPLLAKYAQKQKYFRYPRMKPGRDQETNRAISAYLLKKGFTEAPFTIEARDAKFSEMYCAALSRRDNSCVNVIKTNFILLLSDTALRARRISREVMGRESKQILMIEANQFTCDMFPDMVQWWKEQGIRIISLEEALADPLFTKTLEDGENAALRVYRQINSEQRGEQGTK